MESRDGDTLESERSLQGDYGNRGRAQCSCRENQMANKRDEAYGILCLSITRDLLFHLDGLTSPNEVWENLVDIFGNMDEMNGHQIENELISLSPNSFESLQLYFSKFKAIVLQLKQCGIEKKKDKLVLAILSKLGPNCSVFFFPSMPPS